MKALKRGKATEC